MSTATYTRDLLARTAAASTSLVDLMRRLDAPLGSDRAAICATARALRHRHLAFHRRAATRASPPRYSKELSRSRRPFAQHPRDARVHGLRSARQPVRPHSQEARPLRDRHVALHQRAQIRPGNPAARRARARSRLLAEPRGRARRLGIARQRSRTRTRHSGAWTLTASRPTTSWARVTSAACLAHEPQVRSRDPGTAGAGLARTKTVHAATGPRRVWAYPHACDAVRRRRPTGRASDSCLEIDHINGDRLDNRRENLRFLCPSLPQPDETFAMISNPRSEAQYE